MLAHRINKPLRNLGFGSPMEMEAGCEEARVGAEAVFDRDFTAPAPLTDME